MTTRTRFGQLVIGTYAATKRLALLELVVQVLPELASRLIASVYNRCALLFSSSWTC